MSIFHTHVVLPFADRDRYAGLPWRLRQIRRFERLSEREQKKVQQQRLRRLLEHAYETVPFHRQRFDEAGFRPLEARIDRPLRLPEMNRNDLRNPEHALLSSAFRHKDLRRAATGGNTGAAVQFHRDAEGSRNKNAMQIHLNSWAGFEAGNSVMTVWGAHRELATEPEWRWQIYEESLLRRVPAASGTINDEIMELLRNRYERQRPRVLYGHTAALVAFAAYLKRCGMKHRARVIISTAQMMPDESRKLVESVFGVAVNMFYGNREVGMVAAECSEHEGLHFHPWSTHVEFDPIGQTAEGPAYRLLVTDLLNYGQPIIRYDTGDCVTLPEQRCSCGRWFPVVRHVLGRVIDGKIPNGGKAAPNPPLAFRKPVRKSMPIPFWHDDLYKMARRA